AILDQQPKTLAQYYSTYFSTWSDYFIFTSSNPTLYNGPFSSSTTTDDQHDAHTIKTSFNPNTNTTATNTIQFSFASNSLTGIGDTLHFMILTVDKGATTGSPGNVMDSLISVNSIDLIKGRVVNDTDVNVSTPPAAADITTWEVEVF
ncbi:hypothetical protein HOH87_01235, partial [bacterium]|nr:hypothetical protein [bacterium]